MESFARIVGARSVGEYKPRDGRKTVYNARISGRRAVEWMMTLYSLLHLRRRAKAREAILAWLHYVRLDNEGMKAAHAASMTAEVRAKIAAANTGKKRTAEQCARIAEAKRLSWARRKRGE